MAIGLVSLLLGLIIPWVVTPGAGTTMGAQDLAEWMSLHPVVRAEFPGMFSALSLRAAVVWVSIFLALARFPLKTMLAGSFLLSIASLPPIEMLQYPQDANYLQQVLISLATAVLGLVAFRVVRKTRAWGAVLTVLATAGAMTVLFGVWRGVALLNGFGLPVNLGGGAVLYGLGALVMGISLFLSNRNERQDT